MRERRKMDQPAEPTAAESLVRKGRVDQCRYYLSTGSTLLDLAVSGRWPGGVGSGRVTQIIGDNSTAKTVVAKEILGAAQRAGGYAIEQDAEYAPDFGRARLFGLDVGAWDDEAVEQKGVKLPLIEAVALDPKYCYRHPLSVESVFDDEIGVAALLTEGLMQDGVDKKTGDVKTKKAGIKLPGPLVVAVDTFTALPSKAEEADRLDKASYRMAVAKSMSGGFRKWLKHIGRTQTTIVAVDHIRSAVGVVFGPEWTTSGGKAMQQYASTRIFLAHAGAIKRGEIEIGVWIRAKVIKNKIAPPFREAKFAVLFDYGIDDVRSNLEWLREQAAEGGRLRMSGAWYGWGEDRLGQGIEGAIIGVESKELEAEVEAEVERVWRELHAPPNRKARKR